MVSHSTETISTAPSRAQRLAKKGDIFYQTVRPYQKNNYLFEKDERNYVFSTGYAQLRPSVNERFLFYLTQNGNFVNMVLYNCTGTSYPAINSSDMRRIDIYLSRNSTEQKCIGNTIKTIDHLITLHQSKSFGHILKTIVSCTLYWEQRKLGDIADKVVEKNFQLQERDVFTNSAEFGIIEQKDFFDHEIVNKNNIGGYYIVSPNDFVYNPRISVTAPVGPINRNKLCKRGIMSPLYTVFHPRNMNETFLEFYFKTNKWHKFMEYNGDSGARSDRFSIKTELFYAMKIPFPSNEEQLKVGICFESIDHLITLHQLEPFKLIFKAIAYRIIDYAKSKPPRYIKYEDII